MQIRHILYPQQRNFKIPQIPQRHLHAGMPHDLLNHSNVFGLLVNFNGSSMAKAIKRLVGF